MTQIEITEIPPLKPDQQSLLDMHSVLNVLNVLWTELAIIGLTLANNPTYLADAQVRISRVASALRDPSASLASARGVEELITAFREEVGRKLAAHPGAEERVDIIRSLDSLDRVFAVLRVRARELLARAGNPELWVEMTPAELTRDFRDVLGAIETASRGGFRIVFNAALQEQNDYYIDLRFESETGEKVRLPLVFKDVMRDLIANARKYTPRGGRIAAALHADGKRLRFVVIDTGRGIPTTELASVVDYGKRGSNVLDVRTMGGGFGLTKAFFVAKQFNGRFWIASEVGVGTRVTIEIPVA